MSVDDPTIASEVYYVEDFSKVCLNIWHDHSYQVNLIHKTLQISTYHKERSAQLEKKKLHIKCGFIYNMNKLPEKEKLKTSYQTHQHFLTN